MHPRLKLAVHTVNRTGLLPLVSQLTAILWFSTSTYAPWQAPFAWIYFGSRTYSMCERREGAGV
jgi:hypothetical protein